MLPKHTTPLILLVLLCASASWSKTVSCNGAAKTPFGDFVIASFELTPVAESSAAPSRPGPRDFYSYKLRLRYRNGTETAYVQPTLLVTFSGTRRLGASVPRPSYSKQIQLTLKHREDRIEPGAVGEFEEPDTLALFFDVSLDSCTFELAGAVQRVAGPKEQALEREKDQQEQVVIQQRARASAVAEVERQRQEELLAVRKQEAMRQAQREIADAGDRPGVVEVTGFALYQDPYQYKGKLLWLNPGIWPLLRNGSVFAYEGFGPDLVGFAGVRFQRMLDPQHALYDLVGQDLSLPGSRDLGKIGEMVIQKDAGASGQLRMDRIWHVEALGAFTGVNAFGTPVKAPLLRFLRYKGERPTK